jgi:uncharacterized membrane protein
MDKGRMEAFSDGVFAIIITIMVLELKVPHGASWEELAPLIPKFLSYVLSFVFVGIYWTNHHHTMKAVDEVNGRVLWLNIHLLFWLTLIPFFSAWMGENSFATIPVALYGVVLLMAAIAYTMLALALVAHHGPDSKLARAIRSDGDLKGRAALVLYAVAIPLAFWNAGFACALYVIVAIIWFVPDRRIEKVLVD